MSQRLSVFVPLTSIRGEFNDSTEKLRLNSSPAARGSCTRACHSPLAPAAVVDVVVSFCDAEPSSASGVAGGANLALRPAPVVLNLDANMHSVSLSALDEDSHWREVASAGRLVLEEKEAPLATEEAEAAEVEVERFVCTPLTGVRFRR